MFFYLRVVVMMYMTDRDSAVAAPERISGVGMVALVAAVLAIIYLGILPTQVLDMAADSIATIF